LNLMSDLVVSPTGQAANGGFTLGIDREVMGIWAVFLEVVPTKAKAKNASLHGRQLPWRSTNTVEQ